MNQDFTVTQLKHFGFEGFVTIADLRVNNSAPLQKGVYVVLRINADNPKFLEESTGGHFKGKNPNVSTDELSANWIPESSVLYIGKAGGKNKKNGKETKANLNSRIEQLLRFGQGELVGHWGGRYLWQLADAESLLVCWKTLDVEEPSDVETSMIEAFKQQYNGRRPFANLKD